MDFVLHTSEDFLFGKSIHAEKDWLNKFITGRHFGHFLGFSVVHKRYKFKIYVGYFFNTILPPSTCNMCCLFLLRRRIIITIINTGFQQKCPISYHVPFVYIVVYLDARMFVCVSLYVKWSCCHVLLLMLWITPSWFTMANKLRFTFSTKRFFFLESHGNIMWYFKQVPDHANVMTSLKINDKRKVI